MRALAPDGGDAVCDAIARAANELESAASLDGGLTELSRRLETLRLEAEDVAGELRGYAEQLDGEVGDGLEHVEERLALFARLERMHGGTIADVLAHDESCRGRIAELEGADEALEGAEGELAVAHARLSGIADELSERRARAAPELAAAVRERLAELAMADAEFDVRLSARADGCGPRGADAIEMQIAANGGGPLAPLREVASGGELSRVMLALMSVAESEPAAAPDLAPLLVFDEIDAGIGGHTARAVGEHLRALAEGRQILCITHLPQVAALAQRHFAIAKQAGTEPATTTVTMLEGDGVVGELVRMLGAEEGDRAARARARAAEGAA